MNYLVPGTHDSGYVTTDLMSEMYLVEHNIPGIIIGPWCPGKGVRNSLGGISVHCGVVRFP